MTVRIKDPGSALTHFIAMIMALCAATPLLMCASRQTDRSYLVSFSIFMISMVLLYAASTTYHTFDISEKVNKILRKIDHSMIFILIAGSYTPICVITLKGSMGYRMCAFVWAVAIAGILVKFLWINCPKWFSSLIYIAMGWICIFAFKPIIHALPWNTFLWLLAGGIIYTIGGVIYALKLSVFNKKHRYFGSHEIFHIFVMLGSACHFICMYSIANLNLSM